MPDVFVAPSDEPKSQKKTPAATEKSSKDAPSPPEPVQPGEIASKSQQINITTAFRPFPEGIHFENQEKDEVIQLFLRKHPITNLPWVTMTVIFALFPLIMVFLFPLLDLPLQFFSGRYLLIFLLFYYLIVFGYGFVSFVTWFYNIGLVTNLRVVDIDVSHITNKNVASTGIADIVDVEYTQSGFWSTFFHFGNVHMQTEGVKPNFEFHAVPDPAKVADVILDLTREVHKHV